MCDPLAGGNHCGYHLLPIFKCGKFFYDYVLLSGYDDFDKV